MAATAQSVCDWLQQQHHVDTSTTAATTGTATASAAEAQRVATAMLTGATDTLDGVIRDCVYVQCTSDDDSNGTTTTTPPHRRSPATHYTHAVLTAIAAAATAAATSTDAGSKARRGKSDATATTARTSATYKHALLRYAALAHSLHPYTVFALLREAVGSKRRNSDSNNGNNSNSSSSSHCLYDHDDDDGLMLALAALLVRKVELQAGGLRRLPHFVPVVHTLFAAPAAATTTTTTADVVVQHRFVAALCRTACSAVAVGSLDAACLLAVLADAAVTCVYALDTTTTTTTTTMTTAERNGSVNDTHDEATIAACTREIAAALTFLSSYVQWSLHGAAPALGVLSAHVGCAYAQTKEAAVRDGASHPIALSRPVDIAPLSVARTRAPAQL